LFRIRPVKSPIGVKRDGAGAGCGRGRPVLAGPQAWLFFKTPTLGLAGSRKRGRFRTIFNLCSREDRYSDFFNLLK